MTALASAEQMAPAAAEALLEVRGLSVRYGSTTVLDDLDLEVTTGEVVVVLGPSGSGKSSLLRAVMGLVPAPGRVVADRLWLHSADGRIDLNRIDRRRWRQIRGSEIGFVFQDAALALTPLRRVGSLAAEASVPRPDMSEHITQLLGDAGFADPTTVSQRRAFELSGGMAQRAGMALAVARSPRLLLADEPTTALDGPTRAELLGRMRARVRAGCGLVLVTHDVSIAAQADRILVVDAGHVVDAGPPAEVLRTPTSECTRRLVVSVPWALAPRAASAPAKDETPPVLEVRGLTHGFRRTGTVLRGVDLTVRSAEVVGVAGISGAGKSTLLRCLVGLESPQDGTIRVAGNVPSTSGWRATRRHVQLIPQDPRGSLNPWRTAAQLVADPLDYHHIGRRQWRRQRALELLRQVGLGDLAQRRPNELSSGQCQRVGIVRALAADPQLVVADEPSSALDVELQAEVLRLLNELVSERGTAMLVVSHDVHVLERLCDRIVVLADGQVVEDLAVDRFRSHARHRCARELLDSYPLDPLGQLTSPPRRPETALEDR